MKYICAAWAISPYDTNEIKVSSSNNGVPEHWNCNIRRSTFVGRIMISPKRLSENWNPLKLLLRVRTFPLPSQSKEKRGPKIEIEVQSIIIFEQSSLTKAYQRGQCWIQFCLNMISITSKYFDLFSGEIYSSCCPWLLDETFICQFNVKSAIWLQTLGLSLLMLL